MACRGVHFAFTETEVVSLRKLRSQKKRLEYLQENLEEEYFDEHNEWVAESDKAWDAMHRALTDGHLTWDGGAYPLNHAVLAGELLYTKSDYIMSLKTPEQVRDVAKGLQDVTVEQFRGQYFRIDPEEYGCPVDETDFEYTWSWFENVRALSVRAAEAGRHILFTVDQ